ncbi:MAG: super-infection exclusion protein B [Vampirovibrio sp.]|nr:super-infection exclusion protein B [Vampirovibrio sp.]
MPTLEQFLDFPKHLQQLRSLVPLLFIVAGILLFPQATTFLKIEHLIEQYRVYIVAIFLFSLADMLYSAGLAMVKPIKNFFDQQALDKKLKLCFDDLTIEELSVLAEYIVNDTTCYYFPLRDGVIGGLKRKGLLYHGASEGSSLSFSFNIAPWAKKRFLENREVLLARLPKNESGQLIPYKSRGW